jgi:hypothetical protein
MALHPVPVTNKCLVIWVKQYLEDKYPAHPLLPKDLKRKALNLQVISISKSL